MLNRVFVIFVQNEGYDVLLRNLKPYEGLLDAYSDQYDQYHVIMNLRVNFLHPNDYFIVVALTVIDGK